MRSLLNTLVIHFIVLAYLTCGGVELHGQELGLYSMKIEAGNPVYYRTDNLAANIKLGFEGDGNLWNFVDLLAPRIDEFNLQPQGERWLLAWDLTK